MRPRPLVPLALILFAPVLAAQETTTSKKPPTFAEAIEQARKAAEAEKLGTAIAALHAALHDLQKKQRAAVLAALPKPEGWKIEEQAPEVQSEEFTAALLGGLHAVTRKYTRGKQGMQVEVTANYPMMQVLTTLFDSPELIEADGGQIVKYGAHRAILKPDGSSGQELMILMNDVHLIKVTAQGVTADDLRKLFDQAFVDRLEKPLSK